jgi:hypothetical protein
MNSLGKCLQNWGRSDFVHKVGILVEIGDCKGFKFLSFTSKIIVDKVYNLAVRCC